MSEIIFLKLGGSLITEKDKPSTQRSDVIARTAAEIAATRAAQPGLRLLLGHGSGSFGHFPAKKYGTRDGVHSGEDWSGFIEVWQQAAALNHLVMEALAEAGLPAINFPPSAMASAEDGRIANWSLQSIESALATGLMPVVYGDVAFDTVRGGTLLSTEDLFVHLAPRLKPSRILLAGDQNGVLADYGGKNQLIEEITAAIYPAIAASLGGAISPDVTGGMAGKVQAMLDLVALLPACEVTIFSGLEPGNIERAMLGESIGTKIRAV